jgi:hypothetical protein
VNQFYVPKVREIVDPTWGRVLTCADCHANVEVFEYPLGYLDEPYWGPYRCGDCLKDVAA